MQGDAQERLRVDTDLRGALERGELSLHYQPICGIEGQALDAVEALVRWEHPELGLVPPDRFIPVAESSGLMPTLGACVLDEACCQLREWQDTAGDTAGALQMSVNLSARQLGDDDLPRLVEAALEQYRIAPERLILEIAESMMMTDVPRTVARLAELKALGVQLAVDDFGTGYSSLAYLQQFPIYRIKIDKSFVDRLDTSEGRALAEGIINLARSLTLERIAEGSRRARSATRSTRSAAASVRATTSPGRQRRTSSPAASRSRLRSRQRPEPGSPRGRTLVRGGAGRGFPR